MNLSEIVDRFALSTPDHPALVFEERVITYAELLRSINRLSNALVKAGVQKGDRIVTLLGNRPEFVGRVFCNPANRSHCRNPQSALHRL